jgi:hypothetical protein
MEKYLLKMKTEMTGLRKEGKIDGKGHDEVLDGDGSSV